MQGQTSPAKEGQLLPIFIASILACGDSSEPAETAPASPTATKTAPAATEATEPAPAAAEPPKAEPPKEEGKGIKDPLAARIKASQEGGAPPWPETANISVPSDAYQVLHPGMGSDWNAYPASNAVVMQGTVQGHIGDHEGAMAWLTASVPDVEENGTTRLEMVVVYPTDDEEYGDGDSYFVAPVPSSKDTKDQRDILLDVKSMTVRDTDGDGKAEVLAEATFKPCCDKAAPDYTETIVIAVQGTEVKVSYPGK